MISQPNLTVSLVMLIIFNHFQASWTSNNVKQSCYSTLQQKGILEKCDRLAKQTWNLMDTGEMSNATNSHHRNAPAKESCCAMYLAINCVHSRSCDVCPVNYLADFSLYRIRAIKALGLYLCKSFTYEHSDKHCKQPGKASFYL